MAAHQIGVVSATKGEVFARNAQGQTRRLSVGDPVMEGDVVVTANGSTIDITPMEGPAIHVAEQQTMAIDSGVLPGGHHEPADGAASPQVAETAAKVIQGDNADFNAQLENEAAAAGLTGGGAEGGHSFVDLMRIVEGTQGVGYDFGKNPPGESPILSGPPEGILPTAGNVTIAVDEDDLAYRGGSIPLAWVGQFEDSLHVNAVVHNVQGNNDLMPGDDLPQGSPTILSGHLNITSPTGISGLIFNMPTETLTSGPDDLPVHYWLSPDGHTLVGYTEGQQYPVLQSIGEDYVAPPPEVNVIFTVEITDVASGTYLFNLYGPLDHPIVGTEDNLTLPFDFTVSNSFGSAVGTLTVNVDDDSPVLLGGDVGSGQTEGQGGSGHSGYIGIPGPGEGGNTLVNGLGGDRGFGENVMFTNDDSSTGKIDVSSVFSGGMNLFGHVYDGFYINNNGNITFNGPMSTYTPFGITGDVTQPMIAPFFADVDTRGATGNVSAGGTSTGANRVYWDFDTTNHVITITWDDVGYYGAHDDKVNAFQLRIFDQGNGNFSFEFRYENIDWTTGDASYGSGGLGGLVAHAGWTAGDGEHYYELPQSGNQSAILSLETTSNPDTPQDGNWVFNVLGGQISNGQPAGDFITVEEETAPNLQGNNETADGLFYTATGTIVDNVAWGADGFGSVTSVHVGTGEDAVSFDVPAHGSITVNFDADGHVITDSESETSPALEVVFNSNGTYTVTVLDAMTHPVHDGVVEETLQLPTIAVTGVDGDGDPVDVPLYIGVQDDVPVLADATVTATVDEDDIYTNLSHGTSPNDSNADGSFTGPAGWGGPGPADVTGSIASLVSFGADGRGDNGFSLSGNFDGLYAQHLASAGQDLDYRLDGNTLQAYVAGSGGEDPTPDRVVFTLQLNDDGGYTFKLYDQLDHASPSGEDVSVQNTLPIDLSSAIIATDGDGDSIPLSGDFTINITDDVPQVNSRANYTVQLEDDDLPPNGLDNHSPGDDIAPLHATGTLNHNYGADEAGGTLLLAGATLGQGFSYVIDQGGLGMTIYQMQGQGEDSASVAVLHVTLADDHSGNYTVEQLHNILHPAGQNENNIDFSVQYLVTDGDGDRAYGSFHINVDDDMPVITDSTASETIHTLTLTNMDQFSSAGYHSSFGYYIKDADGNPTTGVVLWDNVQSHNATNVSISGYAPGQIGFFIIPDGDNLNSGLAANTAVHFVQNASGNWQAVAGTTPLVGRDANVLFDVSSLNHDGLAHAVDNGVPGNLNWEDISGGGDRDWNDVNVNAVWTTGTSNSTTVMEGSSDVTGVLGFNPGADGASVTAINDITLFFGEDGYSQSIDTGAGTIAVKADGTYKFTPAADLMNDVTANVKYSVTDGDGDKVNGYIRLTTTDRSEVSATDDTATATEGHWIKSGTENITVTMPASETWSSSATSHNVSGSAYVDPYHPGGARTDDSSSFTVSANSGHPVTVEFDIHVQGYQSGDQVRVDLMQGSTVVKSTGFIAASDNNVQFTNIVDGGTYYLRVYADDNSSNGDLKAWVDGISYNSYSYTYTPAHSETVSAPGLAWVDGVGASGNVMVNDSPGSEGALVTDVDGTAIASLGYTTVIGDYGTLSIDAHGNYTYTPNEIDNPAGVQDVFSYTLVQPDGDSASADLTVSITNYSYNPSAGGGNTFLGGGDVSDTLTGDSSNEVLYGGAGNDTLNSDGGNDHLVGGTGDDTLNGGSSGDILEGGAGNDFLTGGSGSSTTDAFVWKLGETGTDHVTDFKLAPASSGGDILDLHDLLTGEHANAATLDAYLNFGAGTGADAGKAVITVDANGDGSGTDQTIVLSNVTYVELQTYAGGTSDVDIITKLLQNGNLKVDS
jgi:T1SS-143 domain-containing protein